MFDLRNDQRASQYRTGIALAAPSRDGIAENAPCKGSTTSRRFILSLGLDPLERSQDVDGLEIGYRARCDWLQLLQHPVCLLRGGVCLALSYLLVDVLLRDFTPGVGGLETSEVRLVGKACVSPGRSRWSAYH